MRIILLVRKSNERGELSEWKDHSWLSLWSSYQAMPLEESRLGKKNKANTFNDDGIIQGITEKP